MKLRDVLQGVRRVSQMVDGVIVGMVQDGVVRVLVHVWSEIPAPIAATIVQEIQHRLGTEVRGITVEVLPWAQ